MGNLIKAFSGKWISVLVRPFGQDKSSGKVWEYVVRNNSTEAVCIVATVPGDEPQIVLIKQFRYPLEGYVIEFPAGLSDPGEAPEVTAVRELREETGYSGTIEEVSKPVYTSPGLTNERLSYVRIRVTEQGERNLDGDEDIETFLAPLSQLRETLEKLEAEGCSIDAKLWFFASAWKGF